ncbi:MAG: DUF2442 domain-containing protein [Atopobiaceae bacterium]|nr:DUF2442 domain-containing protein [Atopobiaceae bacterium]MBR1830590.1 DUF2442 domain-containing protein [Atopobiaceae bacterium]
MYELDGICYAGVPSDEPRIVEATPLTGGMLLVSFASGEKRLFDVTDVSGPASEPLQNKSVQMTVAVEHGFVSWLDGTIDLAPSYVYEHSVVYNDAPEDLLV